MGMDQLKEEKDSWKNKSAKVAVIDSGINVDHQWFHNYIVFIITIFCWRDAIHLFEYFGKRRWRSISDPIGNIGYGS